MKPYGSLLIVLALSFIVELTMCVVELIQWIPQPSRLPPADLLIWIGAALSTYCFTCAGEFHIKQSIVTLDKQIEKWSKT